MYVYVCIYICVYVHHMAIIAWPGGMTDAVNGVCAWGALMLYCSLGPLSKNDSLCKVA